MYLVESHQGPEPRDKGVDEGGRHVPPLPSLLPGVGRRGGDEEVRDGVDQDEGDDPGPGHHPPAAALPRVRHGPLLHDPGIRMDMSTNCVLSVFLDIFCSVINFSESDFINAVTKGVYSLYCVCLVTVELSKV